LVEILWDVSVEESALRVVVVETRKAIRVVNAEVNIMELRSRMAEIATEIRVVIDVIIRVVSVFILEIMNKIDCEDR
jgi:glycerol-3-phosphate cytidylyltransferase-like family protein